VGVKPDLDNKSKSNHKPKGASKDQDDKPSSGSSRPSRPSMKATANIGVVQILTKALGNHCKVSWLHMTKD